jgi:hypothetical protein
MHVKNVRKCSPHLDALRIALSNGRTEKPVTDDMEVETP